MTTRTVRLGLRENRAQFTLLVAVNVFVGAMVGLERSTLPLVGRDDFGLASSAAVLSFIVAFGVAKALTNLAAGSLAARAGRRRLLIAGWAAALPVPLLIAVAPGWGWIVAANALLGVNQGLAWSMTVVMKIDLVGPKRRGFALGLNESAGYGGLALAAGLGGWLAADHAARDVLVVAGGVIAVTALLVSVLFVRDTAGHVALEQAQHHAATDARAPGLRDAFARASYREPALRSCSQAGLANNLNDALAWGLVPLYLAAHGASVGTIALIAALYPGVWSVAQIAKGIAHASIACAGSVPNGLESRAPWTQPKRTGWSASVITTAKLSSISVTPRTSRSAAAACPLARSRVRSCIAARLKHAHARPALSPWTLRSDPRLAWPGAGLAGASVTDRFPAAARPHA